jgi:site-specific recombinase XerD
LLPVTTALARVLDDWSAVAGVGAGPLVRQERRRNERLSAETISTYVSRWMRTAGLKRSRWDGRSAHALRHTAASDVLDACHDLRVVQAMLGHEHLSSTSIYLRRASLGQMREAMEGRGYLAA